MNNLYSNIDCLGVVLAGGLSSRMGQDKAQLQRNNGNMLDFSQQLLKESGIQNIVISGDSHQVPDLIEKAGPVGGIYSVLAHYSTLAKPKSLLILPVDLPLMTASALKQLRIAGELSQKATYFRDAQGKDHNIPLYLPNNAYLELFLSQTFQGEQLSSSPTTAKNNKKHGPSIRSLLKQVPNQAISISNNAKDVSVLFNSNTPQDWKKAQKQFA